MITIKIKKFQSIKNPIAINLSGFTVIHGESNRGKSAIIRAIKYAFSNFSGVDYITLGEEGVELEWTYEGHSMLWCKNGSSTSYVVDGKKINRPGAGVVPDEVGLFGIREIRTSDKKKHWPQIQGQFDGPFILTGCTDSIAAELLGSNSDISHINKATKLVSSELSRLNSLESVLKAQENNLDSRLKIYQDFETILDSSRVQVESSYRIQEDRKKDLENFQRMEERYRVLMNSLELLEAAREVLVPETLDFSYYQSLDILYNRYQSIQKAIRCSQIKMQFDDFQNLRDQVYGLDRLYHRAVCLLKKLKILGEAQKLKVPSKPDYHEQAVRFQKLTDLQKRYIQVKNHLEALERKQIDFREKIKNIDRELKEVHQVLEDVDICPFCTAPIRDGKYCVEATQV